MLSVEARLLLLKAHLCPVTAVGAVWLRPPQRLLFFFCLLGRHCACHSDRPYLRLPLFFYWAFMFLLLVSGLHVASNKIANNIWPVMILFSQTLPFCIFVTHCRFCEDCFIIFVYHLLHSIWYLARIFASILSDINKIQPVHRLSSSTFASLMCWKIILLCSRQLEKPGILVVNQCIRSIAPTPLLVISSNVFLVRWQRASTYETRVRLIFSTSLYLHYFLVFFTNIFILFKLFVAF